MEENKANILIVDDSPQKLLAMEAILSELGQNVVCVQSGGEALRRLLVTDFAVVLLDVNMPGMDGFETAELIRQRRRSERTPILFVTSMSDETHAAQGYSLGAVDYILAPVIPEVLRAKVSVFVELFRTNQEIQRQADQRVALIQAEAARAEAEQANRAKSEFLANVSHELRTPMNAIIGMTDLALEENISPTVRDFLETARESAGVLLSLLNEILDLSRLESGKFGLEAASFDLRHCVQQTVDSLVTRADQKRLKFICDVEADVPPLIVGDALRLKQVLMNLIGNAIKFTSKGEVAVIVTALDQDEDRVDLAFRVRDTGIGISATDRERIFAPFTQADSSTTRLYGGSGLGLAIASNLVGMMGGRLVVESELGQGSTFSFEVSFPKPPPPHHPVEAERCAGIRVLLTKDHSPGDEAIKEYFERDGANVTTASDGSSALLLWREAVREGGSPFDLVTIDFSVTGFAGAELATHILSDGARATPVILTVNSDERQEASQRLRDIELVEVIEKPVTRENLRAAVKRLLFSEVPREKRDRVVRRQGPADRALRLLVAEDTPANQKLIQTVLSRRGHAVKIAANGVEAVAAVREADYDVILMDIQMPVMGGLEATEAIRALPIRPGRPRIPIIALTAHAMRGDESRCLAAGMDEYVPKPIDTRKLIELVERLGKPTAASEAPC